MQMSGFCRYLTPDCATGTGDSPEKGSRGLGAVGGPSVLYERLLMDRKLVAS